jgi:hypothetical protein
MTPEEYMVLGEDHFVFLAPCSTALASSVPEICHGVTNFDRASFNQTFNQSGNGFLS